MLIYLWLNVHLRHTGRYTRRRRRHIDVIWKSLFTRVASHFLTSNVCRSKNIIFSSTFSVFGMSKYPREKLFSPSVNAGSVFPRATLSPTHDPDDGGPGIKNCKTFLPSKMSSEVMSQCDHIWRNFTTLKNVQSRDNFWAFVHCLAKCWSHFGKKIMLLGELSLWMVKYLKYNLVIWSHWSWHKIWAFVTFRARCLRSKLCCYLWCQPSVAAKNV